MWRLLTSLALSYLLSTTHAQEENDCSTRPDGFYAQSNCSNSFVTCSGGVRRVMQCPADLIFDEAHQLCDYAGNVLGCQSQKVGEEGSGSSGEESCDGRSDGFYELNSCSTQFLTCSGGVARTMNCPAQLVFVETRQLCDYPASVSGCNSGKSASGESSGENSSIESGKSSGSDMMESGSVIKESGNTSKTVEISGEHGGASGEESGASGIEIIASTLATTIESSGSIEESGSGSIEESGNSGDEVLPFTLPTTTKSSGSIEESGSGSIEESGNSGIEVSPFTLPTTTKSSGSIEESGSGLVEESGEQSGSSGSSGQEVESLGSSGEDACMGVADGFYALGCSSLLRACTNGREEVLECPAKLVFNPLVGACDYPQAVDLCNPSRDLPSGEWSGESGSGSGEATFCDSHPDGFYQVDCSSTILACSSGFESTLQCPSGLVFSQASAHCDYPQNVDACFETSGSGSGSSWEDWTPSRLSSSPSSILIPVD